MRPWWKSAPTGCNSPTPRRFPSWKKWAASSTSNCCRRSARWRSGTIERVASSAVIARRRESIERRCAIAHQCCALPGNDTSSVIVGNARDEAIHTSTTERWISSLRNDGKRLARFPFIRRDLDQAAVGIAAIDRAQLAAGALLGARTLLDLDAIGLEMRDNLVRRARGEKAEIV